jgi:hypothetical protein
MDNINIMKIYYNDIIIDRFKILLNKIYSKHNNIIKCIVPGKLQTKDWRKT